MQLRYEPLHQARHNFTDSRVRGVIGLQFSYKIIKD